MSEIAQMLESGTPIPPGTLAVTIDDGYRDLLTEAFPVFQKWKVPVTAYLISDFLDGKLWPWWDQVHFAVMRCPRDSVTAKVGSQVLKMRLAGRPAREAAHAKLAEGLKKVPDHERVKFVQRLSSLFEVDVPRQPPAESAPLCWSEVRKLADKGIEFGVHTRTHPILPNVQDPQVLRDEIAGSKARIEEELGRPALHFCYPNGDFDQASEAEVARCCFATTVTTVPGLNRQGGNRLRLNRLSVEPGLPQHYFREQVAGLHVSAAPEQGRL